MKYATGGRASKNTKSKIAEVAEEMQNKRKMDKNKKTLTPEGLMEYRRQRAKQQKMREDIEEFEQQRRTKEDIRRIEELGAKRSLMQPPQYGAPLQGLMPRRPRGRQLTPEEATRMERLRDEFHGKTQMGTTQLKKGGKVKKGYHKMPDGKIMKNSAHKKTAKCTRGDGCAKKGKTKGRMV